MDERRIEKAYRRKSETYDRRRQFFERSGYHKKGKETAFEVGYFHGSSAAKHGSWLAFTIFWARMDMFGRQMQTRDERYKTKKSREDYQLGYDLGVWEWNQ